MKRILKFKCFVRTDEPDIFHVPYAAQILKIAVQFGEVWAWILADDAERLVYRRIGWAVTGQPITFGTGVIHVNSLLLEGGNYVVHAFDLGEADHATCKI
jgi:hypothetical protein